MKNEFLFKANDNLQSSYDFEVVKRSLKISASKYLKYVLS